MTLHPQCCGRPKRNVDWVLVKFLSLVVYLWGLQNVFSLTFVHWRFWRYPASVSQEPDLAVEFAWIWSRAHTGETGLQFSVSTSRHKVGCSSKGHTALKWEHGGVAYPWHGYITLEALRDCTNSHYLLTIDQSMSRQGFSCRWDEKRSCVPRCDAAHPIGNSGMRCPVMRAIPVPRVFSSGQG